MKNLMVPALAVFALSTAAVPAFAQHHDTGRKDTSHSRGNNHAGAQQKRSGGKVSYTAHQRSCMNRYKSYDYRSDTYVSRGKKVRCR